MRTILRLTLVCALVLGVTPGAWATPKGSSAAPVPKMEKTKLRAPDTGKAAAAPTKRVQSTRSLATPLTTAPVLPGRAVNASVPATTSVIIGFEPGGSSKALRASEALGAKLTRRATSDRFGVVKVPAGSDVNHFIAEMSTRPGVKYVEPNGVVKAALVPNDPGFASQWGMSKIGVTGAWDVTLGSGVVVAVLDTGVYAGHPDLTGRVDTVNGYDFVNKDTDASDDQGHGTHVAGIIAATMNNSIGIAGVANRATILPIKVLGADGVGSDADVAEGLTWAANKGADVINLSLGSDSYSSVINDAVQYAVAKDCVVVAATGNDSKYGVMYPARNSNVIGVGSTTSIDEKSDFSNYGPQVDVVAPGSSIYSTLKSGGYGTMSGTSMATPAAAGVAALIRSAHPTWTRVQVENQLLASAKDLGSAGRDDFFGYGRIDAAAAVGAVTPPPVTEPSDDDEIPGVILPASPVISTLDEIGDPDDVYRVHLEAGETFFCSLTGADGTHFFPALFGPTATSVQGDTPVAMSVGFSYPETFHYKATDTGNHYLDLYAYVGSGEYSLSWGIKPASTEPDDDIPGVKAPASPINGTLEEGVDIDDVFQLDLKAGELLTVKLQGPVGTDFDAYLYGPDAVSVWIDDPVASAMAISYPEEFTYQVPRTGSYYLNAFAYSGSGSYTMTYTVKAAEADFDVPGVALGASPRAGTLDVDIDRVDVYSIPLTAGQTISVWLTGSAGTDFDIYLYPPGTASVYSVIPTTGSEGESYPEQFWYTATKTGTHYLACSAYTGSGAYSLGYSFDDEIPGVVLPPSPVSGALNGGAGIEDRDDVYRMNLTAGMWVYIALSGDAGTEFDLYLHSPKATTVEGLTNVVARSTSVGSTERIMFNVPETGTYYVDVRSAKGVGNYKLTYGPANKPSLSITAPTKISYGTEATIKGVLKNQSGVTMPGAKVMLYKALPGSKSWSYVASSYTSSVGAYKFAVKLSRKTDYQVRFAGSSHYLSASSARSTVTPRVSLSTPKAPKTMSRSKYYTVYGFLKPRHAAGSYPVRIYKWKKTSTGKWKSYGYVKAKASNYSSFTKYSRKIRLSEKGEWRLRAYAPADARHAATWSKSYDYVRVK